MGIFTLLVYVTGFKRYFKWFMYKFILFVAETEAFITDNNTGLSELQNLLLVKTSWVGYF